MLKSNPESKKKFSVTLSEDATKTPTYELFLIRGTSDYMEVQLAKKEETETEINVLVESVFRIDRNAVPQFARQFAKYLQEVVDKQEDQEQPKD